MRSDLPKVLHHVAGRPMLAHVIAAVRAAGCDDVVVVVGHGAEQVRHFLGDSARYVLQEQQLGTAHALAQALPIIAGSPKTLVVYGDMPLVTADTLRQLLQRAGDAPVVLATARLADPRGYGRVIRAPDGRVARVVEEVEASPEERTLNEVNAGVYVFDTAWLQRGLADLQPHAKGEYYLTDLVARASARGGAAVAVEVPDPVEVMGVNDRVQLARAEAVARRRICERLMLDGVTIVHPESTFIDADVAIGRDTVVHPNTYLCGATRVGSGCEIGPGTLIRDSQLGDRCVVRFSVVEEAVLAEEVEVGPYAHLRPGARLERGVHVGNFAEVKNSVLGPGTRMGHFSYVGDATVGREVNIGAGTITCNFDGQRKHPTVVGDGAFLGSDTLLVAPVEVGVGAVTGAGAVVTRSVPSGEVVVGVPARPLRRETTRARDVADESA